jgi:hypothetical protein
MRTSDSHTLTRHATDKSPRSADARRRARERQLPVLLEASFSKKYAQLSWVAKLLNNGPREPGGSLLQLEKKDYENLFRLVSLWIDSKREMGDYGFWQRRGVPVESLRLDMEAAVHIELVFLPKGRAFLQPVSAGLSRAPGKRPNVALHLFTTVVLDPDYERLDRCQNCGKFFVKEKTFLQLKCSTTCGKGKTHGEYKQGKRDDARAEYLGLAAEEKAAYAALSQVDRRRNPDEKKWIASQVNRRRSKRWKNWPPVTKNWITLHEDEF